jgi:hypothetical protein
MHLPDIFVFQRYSERVAAGFACTIAHHTDHVAGSNAADSTEILGKASIP